jgi:nitroreductase
MSETREMSERPDIPAWLDGARSAPSAHNTQPWRFAMQGDGQVLVRWDPARSLPVSDPTARDLYLGLGTAVESACLRALAAGTPLMFVPAPDHEERTVGTLAPAQAATSGVDPEELSLAAALVVRQTSRVPHLKQPIPATVQAELRAEAERWGCRLYIVKDEACIRALARLARQATAAQFADDAVQDELWHWLRLDPRSPAYRRDGLTADCLNLQGVSLAVARLTMTPARMRLLARVGLHHLLALDTQLLVRHSATICLLTVADTNRATLVSGGRALQRLWLRAARAGLTTHPVSALLDCPATVAPTLAVVGCDPQDEHPANIFRQDEHPANIFRLGATPPVPLAPRLPAQELIEVVP